MTQVFGPGQIIRTDGLALNTTQAAPSTPYLRTLGTLARDYDANSLKYLADSTAVASWPDSSANKIAATQATGANQPIYKLINGLPAVLFTAASSQYLDMGSDATKVTDYTIIVVFRPVTVAAQGNFWSNPNLSAPSGGTVTTFAYNSSGNPFVFQNSASTTTFQSGAQNFLAGSTYILVFRVNSVTGRSYFMSGTPIATDAVVTNTATKALAGWIGRQGTGYLDAYIHQLSIFTNSLSDTNVGKALDFLKAKWSMLTLLSDRYLTSPLTAPLTSPRTTTPGPDTVTIVDPNNKFTVSGGKLQFINNGSYAAQEYFYGGTRIRTSGKAVVASFTCQNSNEAHVVGWGYNNLSFTGNAIGALEFSAGIIYFCWGNSSANKIAVGTYTALITYSVALVARSNGFFAFIKGGAYSSWTLLWVDATSTVSPLQPIFVVSTQSGALEYFDVVDLPGYLNSDYGPATNYFATSTDAQVTATATGNAVVTHTITAATGVDQEILVRQAVDGSCIAVKMPQAGTIGVYTRTSGGVDTPVGSTAAQTWTNGSVYTIEVVLDGTAITTAVNGTAKNSVTSAINQTQTGVKVSKAGTNLATYPRSGYSIQVASKRAQSRKFLSIGDSKTDGAGDDQPPKPSFNGYQPLLADQLTTATGQQWLEIQRLAVGGTNATYWAARIDTDLALITDTPEFILVNMGTNGGVSDAQNIIDYGYVVDALHAKWPTARILLARFWRNGYAAADATYNDVIIPTVQSTRTSFCSLGMDERLFLPGASGTGTEYTVDGTHPNRAGYTLTATAWKTAMGF